MFGLPCITEDELVLAKLDGRLDPTHWHSCSIMTVDDVGVVVAAASGHVDGESLVCIASKASEVNGRVYVFDDFNNIFYNVGDLSLVHIT